MKKIKTNYKRNLLDSPGLRRGDHILVHGHSVDLPEAAHQAGHLFVVAVAVVVADVVGGGVVVADGVVVAAVVVVVVVGGGGGVGVARGW